MKMTGFGRALIAAVSLTLLAVPAGVAAQDEEAVFDPIVDSTVRIRATSTGREGTGWVILPADPVNRANAAVVVTALGTIDDSLKITVREPTADVEYEATVLARDSDRNLAFLEVKDLKAQPILVAGEAPKVGRPVWALGYSREADESEQNMAANASVIRGSLSRELRGLISTEARAPVNQLEYGATLLPGFEGGPLIDRCARLIGMNIKSAGPPSEREDSRIQPDTKVMNALKSDEIIKAARQHGVEITPASGACGSTAAPTPVEPGNSSADTNSAIPVVADTPEPSLMERLLGSTIFLVVLGLIGLTAAAFGIYTLTRRDPPEADLIPDHGPESVPPSTRTPTEREEGTVVVSETPTLSADRTLRLNGRGPGGEPIDLSFAGSELRSKPVMIGVGTNADVRLPDNRPEHRVSRLHARLGYDGKNFTIEDNKSLNHTFVGGRQLDTNVATPLVHGDVVRFADIDVTVSIV
jgi:S1-C subfamily serine protease